MPAAWRPFVVFVDIRLWIAVRARREAKWSFAPLRLCVRQGRNLTQRREDTNSIGEIIKGRLGRSYEAAEIDRLRHKRHK